MTTLKDLGFKIRSNGFDLIRQMEMQQGKKVSVDSLVTKSGLARATVRKFFDHKAADVSGVSLQSAQHIADLIGVPLCELVYRDSAGQKE